MIRSYTEKDLKQLQKIGQGTEAKVLKDEDYALKIFDSYIYNQSHKEEKINILKELQIPYLTTPIDQIEVDNEKSGYYMQIFNGKTLSNYQTLSIKEKIDILKRIKTYIEDLHAQNIIIGDIRLDNILLNDNGEIKICDTDNFKVYNYNPEVINYFAKQYFNKHKTYDEQMDTYVFNFMTIMFICNYAPMDIALTILNFNHEKPSKKKELISIILNDNTSFEKDYIIESKQLQKKTNIY